MIHLLLTQAKMIKSWAWDEMEKTYSITLKKVAEEEKKEKKYSIEGMIIDAQVHTVKKDEHLWSILRKKGILNRKDLAFIIRAIKKLNPSIKNLNRLYPGQKLIIPIDIKYSHIPRKIVLEADRSIPEELEGLEVEVFRVSPGDSVIRLIKSRYHIPDRIIHNEYLNLVKRINPHIRDLNLLYPGQKLRLPVYPQERLAGIMKKGILPSISTPEELSKELEKLFQLLGAEWINTGENYIPLRSGGQIKLKAEYYPILNLPSGLRIIVDMNNTLPERMADIIRSNWDTYRIVRIKGCNLREAVDKILEKYDSEKIHRRGDPLELGGSIGFKINADWIIEPPPDVDIKKNPVMVIILLASASERTPPGIIELLKDYGIRIIDYPPLRNTPEPPSYETDIIEVGENKSSIVENALKITGINFTKGKEIAIFETNREDISLIVHADYMIKRGNRDAIIDLTGIGREIEALLKQKRIPYLSLSGEISGIKIFKRVLDFMGIKVKDGVHSFRVALRPADRNIFVKLNGLTFKDKNGQPIFVTSTKIPDAIVELLAKRSFKIIEISGS